MTEPEKVPFNNITRPQVTQSPVDTAPADDTLPLGIRLTGGEKLRKDKLTGEEQQHGADQDKYKPGERPLFLL